MFPFDRRLTPSKTDKLPLKESVDQLHKRVRRRRGESHLARVALHFPGNGRPSWRKIVKYFLGGNTVIVVVVSRKKPFSLKSQSIFLVNQQCDQIRLSLKVLGGQFSNKISSNILVPFGLFKKHNFSCKNCKLLGKIGVVFSLTSGHTVNQQKAHFWTLRETNSVYEKEPTLLGRVVSKGEGQKWV